nr:hypothetical protein [Tanacetum cinerariifolium]
MTITRFRMTPEVKKGLQDIYEHVIEIPLQRIEDIKMGQIELEARSLFAGRKKELVYLSRSLVATVISSIYTTRALVPFRADLLPLRKRFRDSISPEDNVEEDIDMDVLEDIKADATAIKVAVDRDVKARIDVG